jgi:hypothetical protein
MLNAYVQKLAMPMAFLAGFFVSPPQNFYKAEEVEIDIKRGSEEVAVVVQDISAGYRMNSANLYTNKGFKPPVYKESIALNSYDLLKRRAGENPFQQPDFRAGIIESVFDEMSRIENKIRRSIELQASQILTSATLTLTDAAGLSLYALDFKPKATHFPTSAIAWNAAGATILADLISLSEVIRADGLDSPDQIIMGTGSWEAFLKDPDVKARFETRRIDLGTISPMQVRGNGGTFRGVVDLGNYRFDLWTYDGRYKHPQTGVSTPFIANGKVIMRASNGRLDATFGAIPNIGRELGMKSAVSLPELPGRFSNATGGMDMHTNVWLTPDGDQLFAGLGARPLLIPTAIDTYGCLSTGVV